MDLGEFALTFAPGTFAGAAAGRGIRLAVDEPARDPGAFIAVRRLALADDAGVVEVDAFLRGDPIATVSGATLRPIDAATEADLLSRVFAVGRIKALDEAAEYQAVVCGDVERRVPMPDGTFADVDGIITQYGGVIGDAKQVRITGTSFHNPQSFPEGHLRDMVVNAWTAHCSAPPPSPTRSTVRASSRSSPATPMPQLDADAAAMREERMRALGLESYARIHPGGI